MSKHSSETSHLLMFIPMLALCSSPVALIWFFLAIRCEPLPDGRFYIEVCPDTCHFLTCRNTSRCVVSFDESLASDALPAFGALSQWLRMMKACTVSSNSVCSDLELWLPKKMSFSTLNSVWLLLPGGGPATVSHCSELGAGRVSTQLTRSDCFVLMYAWSWRLHWETFTSCTAALRSSLLSFHPFPCNPLSLPPSSYRMAQVRWLVDSSPQPGSPEEEEVSQSVGK